MARRAFSFVLHLNQVGPVFDPEFLQAPASVRGEVLRWVLVYGLKEKDADLAAGLDRHGAALAPIAASTREHRESAMGPADPDAPPLMPAYAVSRTRLLLTGEAKRVQVEFYWEYDEHTGGSWGQILDYQRKGKGPRGGRRPKRDVIGISEAAIARVRAQVTARWRQERAVLLGHAPAAAVPGRMAVPTVPPERIRVIGKTDFEHFTYGIGGPGSAEASARALAGGGSTGFFQRRPGTGQTAYGGPPPNPGAGRPFRPEPPIEQSPFWKGKTKEKTKAKAKPVVRSRPSVPSSVGPRGPKVSEAIDVWPGPTANTARLRDAIAAIDQVHGDGTLPTIAAQCHALQSGRAGEFRYTIRPYRPHSILMSPAGRTKELTVAHEVGHYLEKTVIPGSSPVDGKRDWASDPTLGAWLRAVQQSDGVRTLQGFKTNPNVTVVIAGRERVVAFDPEYVDYLLSPEELWARSYAQYIALRSNHAKMREQVAKRLTPSVEQSSLYAPTQWAESDFEPIAREFDALLSQLGWRR